MRGGDGDIAYPAPWAATVETSFVEPPEIYRQRLAAAGFVLEQERNRRDFALALGRQMRERVAKHGLPPLGLHTLMGPETPLRLVNVMQALETASSRRSK